MSLTESMLAFFEEHGLERTYWVAYSGGIDSHALLSLCVQLQQSIPIKMKAIHVNHGLNKQADAWADHCQRSCDAFNIDLYQEKIACDLSVGESLEEVARTQRYAALGKYLSANDFLLTAHHQDDQAETLLIQLLRGAGPKGLAAMPEIKPFYQGYHARPLLFSTRDAIMQYALAQKLKWVDDDSNDNTQLTRNYIRHAIMPVIKKKWPAAASAMARSAGHCAELQALADSCLQRDLSGMTGSKSNLLSVSKLLLKDKSQQRLLLRAWLMANQVDLPPTARLNAILNDVLTADWDRMPSVTWGDVTLRRYRDDLYLVKQLQEQNVPQECKWDLKSDLTLPGIGVLSLNAADADVPISDLSPVTVTFRRYIKNKNHLKNLYQENAIPPWERETVPILTVNDEIVCIVGYYLNKNYINHQSQGGMLVQLKKTPSSVCRRG